MRNYLLSNKGVLKISRHAYDRMATYIQTNEKDEEGGGVILGRFIIDSKNIIIDDVTLPMLGDKKSRFSFFRSAKPHQRVIDNKWEKSNGTCHYLGEWHTHPEEYPTPSVRDWEGWNKQLKDDKFTSRYLYFVILGTKDFYIWEGDRRTLKFKKLEKHEK